MGISVFALLLSSVFLVLRSSAQQGQVQSREIAGWQVYCRITEALRQDLRQAAETRITGGDRLEIRIHQLDSQFKPNSVTIVWERAGPRKVRRTENGVSKDFDFSGILQAQETLHFSVRNAPL